MATSASSFPSPYELTSPAGSEGWRDIYPYYLIFNDKLRAEDEKKFWFCDSQHWPFPFKPFDVITVEFAVKCLSQYNTRHLIVPPANGLEARIHQRLSISQSGSGGARENSGPRATVSGAGRILLSELEYAP